MGQIVAGYTTEIWLNVVKGGFVIPMAYPALQVNDRPGNV